MNYETENIEFKAQFAEDIYKEVIAFANTDGGVVYVGIDNDGNAVGLTDVTSQPILVIANEGEVRPHLVCHPGEEYIFIYNGEMNFTVADKVYLLRSGDSLFFQGTQPHGITSVNSSVQYVDVLVGQSLEESGTVPQAKLIRTRGREKAKPYPAEKSE